MFKNILILLLLVSSSLTLASNKPNILFISVDDLRPSIGAYGDGLAKTPNIDDIASQGTVFTKAFASVPTCGASRASLLTGIRPTSKRFVYARTYIQVDAPGATTLPKHFKDHGYYTQSLGKITHHKDDIVDHWSEVPWRPKHDDSTRPPKSGNYYSEENIKIASEHGGKSYPYENTDYDEEQHLDAVTAAKAVNALDSLAKKDEPFFLAVGFSKPHLPFSVPKKYWDFYPEEKIVLPSNYFSPRDVPDVALHTSGELRTYFGMPNKMPVSDEVALKLRHGYYASVSFADAQVGKLLKALRKNKLDKNTIVVVWGDHGWNLGEHKLWNKHSNFSTSLHSPLIFSVPGKYAGQQTSALTEFVDIFPTLCDLVGLPKPNQLQGESLVKLMKSPHKHRNTVAFSQWKNGTSMFTDRYAYTQWYDKEGNVTDKMLFDHRIDPDENVNIAQRGENINLIKRLSTAIEKKRKSIK